MSTQAEKLGKCFKRLRAKFQRQGGLCSLCGGPMVLINFGALKPADRRIAFRNPLAATIDHCIPPQLLECEIDNNMRAAHKACNEMKASELIEPYPLQCYDPPLPKIKLGPGVYIEMEAA